MSAPFNGTKTRVVGFLKGLFGKSSSSSSEASHDDGVYDYNNVAPVTGAQLSSPAPVMPTARTAVNNRPAATLPPSKNGNGHTSGAVSTAAQPATNQNGHANGFSISAQHAGGHVNGVVVSPKVIASKPTPVAPTSVPVPVPVKPRNGSNGNSAHTQSTSKPAAAPIPANGQCINLPLAALVAALPLELQARVIKKNFGDVTVVVSLDVVLSQLPTGVVKIPFATMREVAPHCFTPNAEADQLMVTVPLGEVLRQVNPAQLAKPSNQVRITADDDITSPFAEKGNNTKLEVKGTAPTRSITPAAPTPPLHGSEDLPKLSAPTARFAMPATPKPSVPPAPAKPTIPATPSAPIPMPKAQTSAPSPAPASPKPAPPQHAPIAMPKAPAPTPSPAAAPAPTAPPTPKINGVSSLRLVSTPNEPASAKTASAPAPTAAPAAATAPKQSAAQASLTVALKSLVDNWPEAVKQELHEQNLVNGSVDLPLEDVAGQLKNGRVAFTWQMIRSWMTPRPGVESAHGSVEVELPLKVIAPAFLGLKKSNGDTAQRLTADDRIPNVFAQAATNAAPTAPAPTPVAPVATPAPAQEPAAMTPEAVVKRAAALSGVAGALVALPDGLVVASKLPPGLSADSLAAFMPQIYAKFDACLKDLSMDGLNNLNFTAGNVPWRVFRTSSVFFAAFGRANEPMPGDWLATLAGELEKK